MKRLWLFVFVLLVAAPPAASQGPDDALVVPGARIGRWALEMTIDDLIRMNGHGDFSALSHPAYAAGFTIVAWRTAPVSALTKDRRKADALSTTVGDFKTDRGVGLESTRAAVIAAYGSARMTVAVNAASVLVYDDLGAGFSVENDRVSRLWVFRPRTGAVIWTAQRPPRPATLPTPPGERIDRY